MSYIASASGMRPAMNYQVKRVTTQDGLLQLYQLRYAHYVERMRAFPPNRFRTETDPYDPFSAHFHAMFDGEVVAMARMVPSVEGALPLEDPDQGFSLDSKIPRATTMEVTRFIALALTNGRRVPKGVNPAPDVLREARAWCLDEGITHWVFSVNRDGMAFLQRYRWGIEPMGEPRLHHGALYTPLSIPLADEDRFHWSLSGPELSP